LKLNALSWEVMRRQRSVSIAVTAANTAAGALEMRATEVEMLFQECDHSKQLADEQGLALYSVCRFHSKINGSTATPNLS